MLSAVRSYITPRLTQRSLLEIYPHRLHVSTCQPNPKESLTHRLHALLGHLVEHERLARPDDIEDG